MPCASRTTITFTVCGAPELMQKTASMTNASSRFGRKYGKFVAVVVEKRSAPHARFPPRTMAGGDGGDDVAADTGGCGGDEDRCGSIEGDEVDSGNSVGANACGAPTAEAAEVAAANAETVSSKSIMFATLDPLAGFPGAESCGRCVAGAAMAVAAVAVAVDNLAGRVGFALGDVDVDNMSGLVKEYSQLTTVCVSNSSSSKSVLVPDTADAAYSGVLS